MNLNLKNKWQVIAMHFIFGVLFIMAFFLYRERLFVDCGYYIFHAINDQTFHVEHSRFVLAISQLLPLAEVYLGAGLKTVLVTYSLSHVLFYYLLFLVVVHRFGDVTAGVAILFLQAIGQLYLYFSPMLEICYGAGLLVVFHVLLNRPDWTRWRWFWLIFLEFMILSSHPENFIIFFFVLAMHVIQNGYQKKPHQLLLILFFILMIVKVFTFSDYEYNKVHYMMKQDENKLYQNFYSPDYIKGIIQVLYFYFKELVIFFFIAAAFLVKEKKWKLFLLFFFTVTGTIVLINVTNYANEFSRYRESLYNPLVPVIVLGFLYLYFNHLPPRWNKIAFILFLFIICHRIVRIYEYSKPFTFRVQQMENIIHHAESLGGSKFTVNLENCERRDWQLNWSYPHETIMISSLEGKDKTITVATDEDMSNIKATLPINDQTFMITRWDIRPDQSLNKKYFNLADGKYRPLNTTDTLLDPVIYKGKLSLVQTSSSGPVIWGSKKIIYQPVSISNIAAKPLHSGLKNEVYLTYNWIEKKTGSTIKGFKTPLEVDVADNYTQVMQILTPEDKGEYQLILDLIIHDQRENINFSSVVEID